MKQEYSDFLPFPYQPEPRQEPRSASMIEALKAYRKGQPITVRATAYHGRNADTFTRTFANGDCIQYERTTYEPTSFADWISRTKAFFHDWYYGMDRVFFSYYIG